MEFKSQIESKISELRGEIRRLEKELESEKENFVAEKVAEGWSRFHFFSEYYGSHPEYGEGDVNTTYLFNPSIDISRWEGVKFSHGHSRQNENNDAWDEWLEGLPSDHYIEL